MRKIRKGRKKLIILLIAIVVIIATIVIVNIVRNSGDPEQPSDPGAIIPLPETTYSNMEVRNVQMQYLTENDQTEITMEIHNTTSERVEREKFDVVWIGADETTLARIETEISDLDVGKTHAISVVLPGNLTSTTEIRLVEK